MTWGAQRAAGADVSDIEAGTGTQYAGVLFDDDGHPLAIAEREEQLFSAEGVSFITAGQSATLTWGSDARRVRVVYVVSEPRQVGFAYGTMDDSGPVGEELYTVQHRDDDSVWAVYRGFHEMTKSLWKNPLRAGAVRGAQDRARQQLRALLPVQTVLAAAEIETEDDGTGSSNIVATSSETATSPEPIVVPLEAEAVESLPTDGPTTSEEPAAGDSPADSNDAR
nr:DUF1990 family protein [Lysinibacter cavernae]